MSNSIMEKLLEVMGKNDRIFLRSLYNMHYDIVTNRMELQYSDYKGSKENEKREYSV